MCTLLLTPLFPSISPLIVPPPLFVVHRTSALPAPELVEIAVRMKRQIILEDRLWLPTGETHRNCFLGAEVRQAPCHAWCACVVDAILCCVSTMHLNPPPVLFSRTLSSDSSTAGRLWIG